MLFKVEEWNTTSTLNEDDQESTIYYCNYCSTQLYYESTDEQTRRRKYVCIKCGIEFHPSNELVRKASKFDVPAGKNHELINASPESEQDRKASSSHYVGKNNLPPLFKMLEGRGWKFKHYEEH